MNLGENTKRFFLSALLAIIVIAIHPEVHGAPIKESTPKIHKLAIPDAAWALEVALPKGFSIEGPQVGRELVIFVGSAKIGWHLTVSMKKAAAGVEAKTARDEYAKKIIQGPLHVEGFKKYEMNDGAICEHINKDPLIREMSTGKVAVYKALSYFLLHDGYLIEVSLRKLSYQKSDQKYFDSIPASIRIVDSKASISSLQLPSVTFSPARRP